jgi:hypothetical protein
MTDEELLRRLKPMLKRRFSKFLTGSSCETWRSIMARNGIQLNSPDDSGLSLWDPVWGYMSVAREDALKILFLGELL